MNQPQMNPMGMNQMGMNPMGMNPMNMNPMGINPMNINPLGINNQQNQFNQMSMDQTTLEVKNIVEPYEKEIKRLQEIIRKKDLEIAVLKQKLNNYSSNNNFMNMNPMMMNQNMNPMMNQGFNQQQLEYNYRKYFVTLKTENGDFKNECNEKDKLSILFEKNKINNGTLIYEYRVLDSKLTFKENGIKKNNPLIYLKDGFFVKNILFQDSYGNNSSLVLSRDCPLQLALIYFLTDSDNVDYLLQLLKGNKDSIRFLHSGKSLNFYDTKPISDFFETYQVKIIVIYPLELIGGP